jgi:hypothetical protein
MDVKIEEAIACYEKKVAEQNTPRNNITTHMPKGDEIAN